jgi:hypothetical protein
VKLPIAPADVRREADESGLPSFVNHQGGRPSARFELLGAAIVCAAAILHVVGKLRALSDRYALYDFAGYYAWGRSYQSGIEWWARTHCNYTPFFVATFAPLARLDAPWAHLGWQTLQIICLGVSMAVLARSVLRFSASVTVIIACTAILSRTSDQVLFFGQFAPILLALMVGSWALERERRDAGAGMLLALAILLKLYPGILLGYYLVNRRWRVAAWTAGFLAIGVLGTGLANWQGLFVYGLPHSEAILARGFWRDRVSTFNLVSLLAARIATPSWWSVFASTAALNLLLIMAAALETIAAREQGLDGIYFGLWLALGLLLAPIAWHHEIVLLFPLYLFGGLSVSRVLSKGSLTSDGGLDFS